MATERVYEVLHRGTDGHETVLRVAAQSKTTAVQRAAERYQVDPDTIVQAVAQEPAT